MLMMIFRYLPCLRLRPTPFLYYKNTTIQEVAPAPCPSELEIKDICCKKIVPILTRSRAAGPLTPL